MHFRIQHESSYRYDVPVTLGPHVLRLTPRADGIWLRSHRLQVHPQPVIHRPEIDPLGNAVTRVEFSGSTWQLHVRSELDLDTLPIVPLDLRLEPLPPVGNGGNGLSGAAPHPEVQRFAEWLAGDVEREPVAFLDHLTRSLYTRMDRQIRPVGEARPAQETLALASGACRDLTILFLEACRSFGLSGRFVSGYQAHADTPDGQRHLHAWAEVFLPGAGWRGWDPTHGVRATDGHIALSAAPTQAGTMPIEGSFAFQGAVVNSTLDHSVRISTD